MVVELDRDPAQYPESNTVEVKLCDVRAKRWINNQIAALSGYARRKITRLWMGSLSEGKGIL